jgi:ABC-type bacteriocin/lantibiotic exporter with double-glycine peptidase domain
VASTESRSPWGRLRAILAPERGDLWVIVLYGLAVGLFSLVVPVATQALVNTAAFGTLLQPMLILAVLVFGMLTGAGVMRVLQVVVAERLQQRLFARMAVEIAHRLSRARLDTHRSPELVNRFFDVMTLQKSTAFIFLDGAALVLQALSGLVLLALYHPYLLLFDLLLLASMTFVLVVLGRNAVRTSIAESYAKYAVVAWLEELARAPLAFRLVGGDRLALQQTDRAADEYVARRQAHFRVVLRQVIGTLAIQALASGILLGLGGWLVVNQQLTLGQLVAAELIVTPVVGTFSKFGKYLEALYDLLAGVDKLGHLFDLPLEESDGERPVGVDGPSAVRLRGVGVADPARPAALADVHLELPRGSRTALLGAGGSGKSALADLLAGLRLPGTGVVEIDGIDVRALSSAALRERVALVRGAALFDGTLLENVRMGRKDVPLDRVNAVLQRLGLLDQLSVFSRGLETHISGAISPLSTGQSLLLALARAVVARPRLLVVDEVLDPLDPRGRALAFDLLLDPEAPWTLLLTTRFEEVARRCPRALCIGGGRIEELRP